MKINSTHNSINLPLDKNFFLCCLKQNHKWCLQKQEKQYIIEYLKKKDIIIVYDENHKILFQDSFSHFDITFLEGILMPIKKSYLK